MLRHRYPAALAPVPPALLFEPLQLRLLDRTSPFCDLALALGFGARLFVLFNPVRDLCSIFLDRAGFSARSGEIGGEFPFRNVPPERLCVLERPVRAPLPLLPMLIVHDNELQIHRI